MYIQDCVNVFPMMTTWHHEAPMPKSSSRQREREVKEEEMNERLAADSLEIPALLSLNGSTQHFIPSLECRHTNTRSLICTSTRLFLLLETISRGWLLMAGRVRTAVKGEKHWPVLTRTVKTQLGVTGRSVVTQHDTGVIIRRLNQSQDADVRDLLHCIVKHPPQVSGLARWADAGRGGEGGGGGDRRENTLRNGGKGNFPPYSSQVKECTCFRGGSLIAFLLRVRSEIPLLNLVLKCRCGVRTLLD